MASRVLASYKVRVELLSPLHIGSGRADLVYDYDFVMEGDRILVMDIDKVLEAVPEGALRQPGEPTISRLLRSPQQRGACVAYSLRFRGAGPPSPQSLREYIKDGFGRPYLPGSSLKGAIRTALAWAQYLPPLNARELGESTREADQNLERQWFVPATDVERRDLPHYDLLRSLKVGDLYPVGQAVMEALAVNTFSLRERSLRQRSPQPTFLEALGLGTVLEGEMALETYLFSAQAAKLNFKAKSPLLRDMVQHYRDFAGALIQKELEFYRGYAPALVTFYERLELEQEKLSGHQFLLQIAWGAGWRAKTIGTKLEPREIEAVSNRWRRRDGRLELERWQRSPTFPNIFPKTRRLVLGGTQEAREPLGWVRVELTPRA